MFAYPPLFLLYYSPDSGLFLFLLSNWHIAIRGMHGNGYHGKTAVFRGFTAVTGSKPIILPKF